MTSTPGKRYSLVHLAREEHSTDSKTARFRIAKLCERHFPKPTYNRGYSTPDYNRGAIDAIEAEVGVRFATEAVSGQYIERWDWYFSKISVTEMLDTITVLSNEIFNKYRDSDAKRFISEIHRILTEENLAFRIDELGSLHPLIDAAFSSNQEAAINALNGPRYTATAALIKEIDRSLLKQPIDYKAAIRAIFGANENLFKLMSGKIRLDSRSADEFLSKSVEKFCAGDETQASVARKMIEGFKSWINAAHYYRHEEGVQEPSEPNPDLAIMMISQGIAFLRWLAQIDRASLQ